MDLATNAETANAETIGNFLNRAALGFQSLAADGRIVWANQTDRNLLGYPASEYIGRNLATFHVDAGVGADLVRRCAAGETLHDYPVKLRAHDGTVKDVCFAASPSGQAGVATTYCVTRDITTGRDREDSLRVSAGHLDVVLEGARMGTWEWSIPTGRVKWSEGLEAIHGIPVGTFPGTFEAFQSDMHPDDRPRIIEALARTLASRHDHQVEYRIVRPDGACLWVEGRGRLMLDEQGNPDRMLGVCSDISERKEAEAALKLAVRVREDVLAMVSHDLRSPLSVIMMKAGALQKRDPSPRGIRDLDVIQNAAHRMTDLIRDLLDFGSMQAGRFTVRPGPHPVHTLMSQVMQIFLPLADAKGVHLRGDVAGDNFSVTCEQERLVQVLSNLIGNSIKFTPAHGTVTVSVRRDAELVRFSVTDTGVGIAADLLPRIFERYWKAKSGGEGSGLGLFIARGIIEAHGGRIWADSTQGHGCAFHFTLPA